MKEIIETIKKDWFGDRTDKYTKKSSAKRVGWEDAVEGGSFCTYLIGDKEFPSVQKAIEKAFELSRSFLNSLDLPFTPFLVYNPNPEVKTGSYTDGKHIVLDTSVFGDKSLSNPQRIDVVLGLAVHEGLHIKTTDFENMKIFYSRKKSEGFNEHLLKFIFNTMEDERIERNASEEFPGFLNFIGATKYYFFEKLSMPDEKSTEQKVIDTFLYCVRYPKFLDEEVLKNHYDVIDKIRMLLTPYPVTQAQMNEVAPKVYQWLIDFFKEEEEKEDGEGKGSGEGKESKSDKELAEALAKALASGYLKELAESSDTSAAKGDVKGEMTSISKEGELKIREEYTKDIISGEGSKVYFLKAESNTDKYLKRASSVRKFASALARIIRFQSRHEKLNLFGMKNGLLDTNKLAEAVQGFPNVYKRKGEALTEKVAVCLLIDESGSMGGGSTGASIEYAASTAILFKEALEKNSEVDLYIYGHSADQLESGSTELYIYQENSYRPKYALGTSKARRENRDGTAIIEVAKRVRKFTKLPVLYFVISDGAPCASNYGGEPGIQHTRQCVKQAEKLGMYVIQIAVNVHYDPAKMFTHFVKFSDFSTLPTELGLLMKKLLKNALKTDIIYY